MFLGTNDRGWLVGLQQETRRNLHTWFPSQDTKEKTKENEN